MQNSSSKSLGYGIILAALSLLLSGCFISPGKFDSTLVLDKDGSFEFTYQGEIFFVGLSKLAQMGDKAKGFEPGECRNGATGETHECTEAEIKSQREEWEKRTQGKRQKDEEKAKQMAQLLGGIDPSDPKANEELRRLLLRQEGWESVVAKGDGVFDVSYRIAGTLDHDFLFPMIEGMPTFNIFVQAIRRKNGQVRVNAPSFSAQNDVSPFGNMLGGLAGLAALDKNGNDEGASNEAPDIPALDGTFTLRTDGTILANNTDEGAVAAGKDQVLEWKIGQNQKAAPTALIELGD